MNILYVGINSENVNPSEKLLGKALKVIQNVTFFGFGFNSNEVIEQGLHQFIKERDFDFIILESRLLFLSLKRMKEMPMFWNCKNDVLRQKDCIIKDTLSLRFPIICYVFEDTWGFTENDIELLQSIIDHNGYILGDGIELIECCCNMEKIEQEKFYLKVNDLYYNFLSMNVTRIISCPLFVSEDEFEWGDLSNRPFDWSVVGRPYAPREIAKKELKKLSVTMARNDSFVLLMRAFSMLQLRPYSRPALLAVYHRLYRDCMKLAKYSFACGMRVRAPLRKFYEVPASGSVLVAYPCKGFENLGFINYENCVITEPEKICEINDILKSDLEKAQTIANKGQQLVWEKHSLFARAKQISDTLKEIKLGNFCGSHWEKGDYIILRKDEE